MTFGLIWRESARQDMRDIFGYIAERNARAALELKSRMEHYAERLTAHPYMCRPGRIPGTREGLAHPNYIVVYRVGTDAVEIVNVLHSRRQYPPETEGA